MELTLNVYKRKSKYRISNEVERVAVAQDFELTTGVCEDVLQAIQIDLFDGGISALSNESKETLFFGLLKDGYPFFIELIKDVFELSDDEAKRLKIGEVGKAIIDIAKYAYKNLENSIGGETEKN